VRRLTLLRHAKSSWDNPLLDDFDRPLNKRGERDAPDMGDRLKARGARPSLIISSDAARAVTTARIIARRIGYPIGFIQPVNELYLASPRTIIDVVIRESERYHDVIVVGHNPGLTELLNQMSDARVDNIPTCGVFSMQLAIDDWTDLPSAEGRLDWYDYPKLKRNKQPPVSERG